MIVKRCSVLSYCALLSLQVGWFMPVPLGAAECPTVRFGEVVNVVSGGSDAETFDVSPNDLILFASNAVPTYEDNIPAEVFEPSRLNVILNRPGDYRHLFSIEVGLGEATCVAAHPSGNKALVTVKDPERPNTGIGKLKLVGFQGVIAEIEVGVGPDSISVSPDGRFAVVANEAETPLFPSLSEYRKLKGWSGVYAQVASDLAAGIPAKLGYATLEDLLTSAGLKSAADLLEAAVDGKLESILKKLATAKCFASLDDWAASLGYASGRALVDDVSRAYAKDAMLDALLAVRLIAEKPSDDAAGSILVLEIPKSGIPRIVAEIGAQTLFDRYFADKPERAQTALQIEPENTKVSPDSKFALVTIQEQSAVAVVALKKAAELLAANPAIAPDALGDAILADVVFLPHGIVDSRGIPLGAMPDGVDVSSDGLMAITANESDSRVRHMQGISIIDFRGGISRGKVVATYSIFDLTPDLLEDTGLSAAPVAAPGDPFPPDAALLPRIDPEGTAIFDIGCQMLVGVALERFEKSSRIPGFAQLPAASRRKFGSILVLDVTGALAAIDVNPPNPFGRGGFVPSKLGRFDVGFGRRAPSSPPRPEVIRFDDATPSLIVANERDNGSISILPLIVDPAPAHRLALAQVSGGVYDVLLTTNEEIAGFAFGLTVGGGCGSAALIAAEPGLDLGGKPGFFATQTHGRGLTVGGVLSLSPPVRVVGPGRDLRIARVKVCGSVFDNRCQLCFTGELGDPPILIALSTPRGRSVVPETSCADVASGGALCFRRGDANPDAKIDIADPINILAYLYLGETTLCRDALDADDSGKLEITDPVYLLNWLFRSGEIPPDPGPRVCGPDPTDDTLDCEIYEVCRA